MNLTHTQKRHILDHGFVKIPGVIPRAMIDDALRAINASIGEGIDPALLPTLRAQSYCPELKADPAITGLLMKTPAWGMLESVIGEGQVRTSGVGQIALRFPTRRDPAGQASPHIDGFYTPTNGVPKGTVRNFTALVGVLLSDLPEPNSGNFTVWPGTHHTHETYFRERGRGALDEGIPKIDLPEPTPITGKAGDIVIAHYLLSHGISPNQSSNIRYACFFRITHADHEQQRWESMTDPWLQWPGIRKLLPAD